MERPTEAFWRGAFCGMAFCGAALAEALDFDDSPVPPEWAALAAVEAEWLDCAKAVSMNAADVKATEAAKLNTKLRIASPFCCICATVSIPETR
jgi:hypothetical protein